MKKQSEILNLHLQELNKIEQFVKRTFTKVDLLNIKPNKKTWSASECLKHLISTWQAYEPIVDKAIKSGKKRKEDVIYKSGWFGRRFNNQMQPQPKKGLKSPALFLPEQHETNEDIITDFLNTQDNIRKHIIASQTIDISKTTIPSPVTSLMRFKLGDAYRIVLTHEWRHLYQAEKAIHLLSSNQTEKVD